MSTTTFTSLRQALPHAATAHTLSLRGQGLRTVPATLAKLTQLETLDLSANPLRQLPPALFGLPNLRCLNVQATGLDTLPPDIGQITQLTELTVGGFDDFEALPEAWAELHNLQRLDLTDANHLRTLPGWLADLPHLHTLRLARTSQLTNLPEQVARLPHLRHLVLDDVPFASWPQPPRWLATLQTLDVSRTQMEAPPTWLGDLPALESLSLDDNDMLTGLPDTLGALAGLRRLDMRLTRPLPLPATLGRLARLERLALVKFGLTEVPTWIFELSNLTWLYLGLNPITHVDPGLARLTRLHELDFGYNPELVPMRQQITQWLPNCQLELSPTEAELAEEQAKEQTASPAPAPAPYVSRRQPAAASHWPEWASLAAWQALTAPQQAASAHALAQALGPQWQVAPSAGAFGLPRLLDEQTGLHFVVIPGGQFEMGLRPTELAALKKLAKKWSTEARAHLRELSKMAGPVHTVSLPPFLCSPWPLTAAQAAEGPVPHDTVGPVAVLTAGAVPAVLEHWAARLPTEAEWEYVARQGGAHSWLEAEQVTDYASLLAAAELALEADPDLPASAGFGVAGLAWGAWVEDAWRPSYAGAPTDGTARLPRAVPETVRGGALLSWPWQVDGEAWLLLTAQRERASARTAFPALLARDLPVRG